MRNVKYYYRWNNEMGRSNNSLGSSQHRLIGWKTHICMHVTQMKLLSGRARARARTDIWSKALWIVSIYIFLSFYETLASLFGILIMKRVRKQKIMLQITPKTSRWVQFQYRRQFQWFVRPIEFIYNSVPNYNELEWKTHKKHC